MNYNKGIKLVSDFVTRVFPKVSRQLKRYIYISSNAGDDILGLQASSSIKHKKFHAQGGSIYALYPGVNLSDAVRFIVSLQTMSDYLDNLCDRTDVGSESAFRQLHASMLDAVDPVRYPSDYYLHFPYKDDNNYLRQLVEECRHQVEKPPSFGLVFETVNKYINMYSSLQSLKHLSHETREQRLVNWSKEYLTKYNELSWWEFAAATGSTLGMFVLYAAAFDPNLTAEDIERIDSAYFPWICGLHILLDYYIDSQEDMSTGDLNFTYYYKNLKNCEERLSFFIDKALDCCTTLRYPEFHITVVKGLLAMYLSDPKASMGLNRLASRNLLKKGKTDTAIYYRLCKLLRFMRVL